jgi:hypothetical protein
METPFQRIFFRISSSESLTTSIPLKRILPPMTLPFEGRIFRMDRAVVVLPHPDSPANPTASPLST